MSLSNTAVPEYYGKFREQVLAGEIPICEPIALEMKRIDDLIEDPHVYYDSEAINGWIKFCERELTLSDGDDLKLLDTFKLWGESIFGWYIFVDRSVWVPQSGHYERRSIKKRLINKQFLIIPRGAAKSMYLSTLQNYFLNVDKSTTQQVTVAPTMIQAEEVMGPIKASIVRSRGPLFKFLTDGSIQNTTGSKMNRAKLASTKKGIENFLTGSMLQVRPMSIDKLQGLKCKIATVDEWLSGDVREDVIGAIEQGASKNEDYLIVAASSEGTVRNGPGDSIKLEIMNILRGEYSAPNVSIWYYKLDDISEVGRPDLWIKANPNLGKTVQYDVYHRDVEKAEHEPSARNDIIAKRFNIPMEGFTYFFAYEDTLPCGRQLNFWKMPCSLGMDASLGDDFFAFTFLFPLGNGVFGVKTRSYITEVTLNNLPIAMRQKYEEFINEGSLIVMNSGPVLVPMQIYDDLDEFIENMQYDIRTFGYDPFNAQEFVERWERENGQYGVTVVRQGSRTESVPLGELKILAENKALMFDEQLMTFTMGNAITIEDTNGNRKLLKQRRDKKIDNVSALMDAYVAMKQNPEAFE